MPSEVRVRRAALSCFAEQGFAAASIRQIARTAGVSVGVVQYHFPSKEALRAAVHEDLVSIAVDAFGGFGDDETLDDPFADAGRRIAVLQDTQPAALRYLVRALMEGDGEATEVFEALARVADVQIEKLAAGGLLREDVEPSVVALQVVTLLLGTVAFEPALRSGLRLRAGRQATLDDWHDAASSLFRHGISRP